MKKTIKMTACLTAFLAGTCFAIPTINVKPVPNQVITLLTEMNSQLGQLTTQQTQTQKTLAAYANFQVKNTYPSTPFPGWQTVLTQIQKGQLNIFPANPLNINLNTSQNNAVENKIVLTSVLKKIQKNIKKSIRNSNIIASRINTYQSVLSENLSKMNLTQIERVKTKIDLLNTEISELKYNQHIQAQEFSLLKIQEKLNNGKKENENA